MSAAFGPWGGTELYANWGLGFHSNSGLGIMLQVDPSPGDPADAVADVRAIAREPSRRAHGRRRGLQTTATVLVSRTSIPS